MKGVSLGQAWVQRGDSGITEGVCSAIEYSVVPKYRQPSLRLTCVKMDGGPESHEVHIFGEGPVVGDLLASFVGMDDLRLWVRIRGGLFGYQLNPFTLRTAAGELLVLSARSFGGPRHGLDWVEIEGWSAPFDEIDLVDYGCAPQPNRPNTWPEELMPFAVEIGTDEGTISVFHSQQRAAQRNGITYEISVQEALFYPPCGDCPSASARFSIVRHPR